MGGKRRQIGILIAVIGLLILGNISCSQQPRKTIRFALSSKPVTLDPRFATDAESSRINRLLYTSLIDFDDNYLPVPQLATWKEITATHYRFRLKKHRRKFHHGKSVTAKDVQATYLSILDKQNASPHRNSIKIIDHITVLNAETIDFYLQQPDPLFVSNLVIGILPADLLAKQHPFNTHPVGNGIMQFLRWEKNRLQVQRLADQQIIEFISIKEPTIRVLKLLRGEIDLLQNNLPFEHIQYLSRQTNIHLEQKPGGNFSYLGFNLQDKVTANLKVRQAIAYAIDRKAIIHYVLGNSARLASSILPPEHWASNQHLTTYAYQPEKAKQLLQEAGYSTTKPLHIVYKTSSNPFRIRLASIIQWQLKKVGINVVLRSYDWGTFYSDIKAGKFQMFSLIWVGIKSPNIFKYVFHSQSIPPSGANRGRFIDKQSDALIDLAATQALSQQAVTYKTLQQRIQQLLPYVPLWYQDHVVVSQQNIQGYHLSIDGNYDGLQHIIRNN